MELPNDTEAKLKIKPTQSQRLRAVIYRLWEIEKKPGQSQEQFYQEEMEKLMNYLRRWLPN